MSALAIIVLLATSIIAVLFVKELQKKGFSVQSDPKNRTNILHEATKNVEDNYARAIVRAQNAYEANRLHDAQMALESALALYPNALEALARYAYILTLQGELESAKSIYLKALALHSDSASLHSAYASLLSAMGEEAKAKEHYVRAIELDPKSATTYFNFGNYLAKLEEYDAAKESYERALLLEKNFTQAKEALEALLHRTKGD